ncbi:hypothetical protein ACH4RA_34490 [Streptomyces smyrnaeus]|uniref:hypothetical protein n=1 Tax=Streptomyces TaxID=1883 RepID=UPI001FFDA6D3|nr:hypothetical protein [Streptomyces sp. RK75]
MDHRRKVRRARLRLATLSAAVVALVAMGGVLAFGSVEESGSRSPRTEPSPDRTSSGPRAPGGKKHTPATASRVRVIKPESSKNGIGTGFPHTAVGARSAAVSYWQDLSFIDDQAAERQLRTIAASPSDPAVRNGVSAVRKVREGVGLPPSGGPPNGMTVTTDVKAVLLRSLDREGDVVQVWMVYDRYATSPEESTDDNPLRDQTDNLIVTWTKGDWKVTEQRRWVRRATGPRAYDPHSPYAFQDGWRQVAGG